jgi:hypothetical protein
MKTALRKVVQFAMRVTEVTYACSECAALVAPIDQERHRQWHNKETTR